MLFEGLSTCEARCASRSWRITVARLALVALVVLLALWAQPGSTLAAPAPQGAGPGETLFQTRCTACHTIGKGKLVGPDLQGVTARRDPVWLKQFIADPGKLIAANDPTAKQLLAENNNVQMPALGLTDAEIAGLLTFLDGTAAPATASGQAGAPAQAALPVGDPVAGWRVFTGNAALTGGGPSCIGCHTVSGLGGLGGGALGPDLTHVAQRYPGPGLAAVLGNIAFPTMAGPFTNRALTPQEQADVVAYLVSVDGSPAAPPVTPGAVTANTMLLLGTGLAGALALIVLLAFFWPRQRQSVSARLRNSSRHLAR
jgi:mono/diheme cytochrome c family protein